MTPRTDFAYHLHIMVYTCFRRLTMRCSEPASTSRLAREVFGWPVAELGTLGHITRLLKIMTRKPSNNWEKVDGFTYDIREPKTEAIFVFAGQEDSTEEERNLALNHVLNFSKKTIEKGRIHYLFPVPKS